MSLAKAREALEFLSWLQSYRYGVTIQDVEERFSVSRRTSQRWLYFAENLEKAEPILDGEGIKRWKPVQSGVDVSVPVLAEDLAALSLAKEALDGQQNDSLVASLKGLQDKLLAQVSSRKSMALETDFQALLEAQGFATRPGPRSNSKPEYFEVLYDAFKACQQVAVLYEGDDHSRRLEPYALIYGPRLYLLAKDASSQGRPLKYFRLDRIQSLGLTDTYFDRDEEFDVQAYASRSFGVFQNEDEYGEVVWQFAPEVADVVSSYQFHPAQTSEVLSNGWTEIRFKASGWLEMSWELLKWGKYVQVVKPETLKEFRYLSNDPLFGHPP